ncbi:MAG: hypothetical protein J6B89_03775 [Bacilli bacterium]|nr:hypothetical protein [Bacilli bacterium]
MNNIIIKEEVVKARRKNSNSNMKAVRISDEKLKRMKKKNNWKSKIKRAISNLYRKDKDKKIKLTSKMMDQAKKHYNRSTSNTTAIPLETYERRKNYAPATNDNIDKIANRYGKGVEATEINNPYVPSTNNKDQEEAFNQFLKEISQEKIPVQPQIDSDEQTKFNESISTINKDYRPSMMSDTIEEKYENTSEGLMSQIKNFFAPEVEESISVPDNSIQKENSENYFKPSREFDDQDQSSLENTSELSSLNRIKPKQSKVREVPIDSIEKNNPFDNNKINIPEPTIHKPNISTYTNTDIEMLEKLRNAALEKQRQLDSEKNNKTSILEAKTQAVKQQEEIHKRKMAIVKELESLTKANAEKEREIESINSEIQRVNSKTEEINQKDRELEKMLQSLVPPAETSNKKHM